MKKKIAAGLAVVILAFLYYYFTLPAINIHESGFWFFLAAIVVVILVVYGIRKRFHSVGDIKKNKVMKRQQVSAACNPGGEGFYRRY